MARTPDEPEVPIASEGVRPGRITALLRELAFSAGDADAAGDAGLREGQRVGRFQLVRQIGRGGFGVVWLAKDLELGREVAFKVVRPGAGGAARDERIVREAEAAARLSHPNIVTLFDLGRSEAGPYLVMELLRGETLHHRLARGRLPVRESVRIAVELARGIAHAHAHGVVHRDLKPANVFLCDDARVKVLDLGLAHAFGCRKKEGGTAGYMSPEQAGGLPEDERTDVWALGAILFEMIAGQRPFPHRGRQPRAPVVDVAESPALGPFVARMLAASPLERPRDGGEVLEALTAFERELERAPSTGRVRVRRRPRVGVIVAAIAGAIAISAGSFVLVARQRPAGEAATSIPSIAVLPFANLSSDQEDAYFSEGVAQEILNALSRLEGLRVPGWASCSYFKGKNVPPAEIGEKLGVSALLQGTVQRSGNRLRITAELARVPDGRRLWSQSFDRELTDVLEIQDQIASAVADALRVKFLGARPTPAGTSHSEAYAHYLLGRHLLSQFAAATDSRAVESFKRALELDPSYAAAWAGLSAALYARSEYRETLEELLEDKRRALEAAERAVALAPGLADGYVARASMTEVRGWDWAGSLADGRHAVELNRQDPFARAAHAEVLGETGHLREAIAEAELATELDPLSASAWSTLAYVYMMKDSWSSPAGRHVELARRAMDRAREISPDNRFASISDPMNREEALAVTQRDPGTDSSGLEIRLEAHLMLEQRREALEMLDRLLACCSHHSAFQIAVAYSALGDRDKAFEWLERARVQLDSGLKSIKVSPRPSPRLRSDPRWATLLQSIHLQADPLPERPPDP